jgi:ribosomal protein S18 acetylase RimI-like enzyme
MTTQGPTARPFRRDTDFPALFDLLIAAKDGGAVDLELRSTSLRLVLNDPGFDSDRLTLTVASAGRLEAFGILWRGRYLGMLVHPLSRGQLEAVILDWSFGATQAHHTPAVVPLCRSDDAHTRAIYERRGLALVDDELRMRRPLAQSIPAVDCPAGFHIRGLDGESELPAWISLYEAAFGPGSSTVQRRAAFMRDPDYVPEADLIALDGHGRLAAMCQCTLSEVETTRCRIREGKLGPIAVAEPYRRHGLGRAIVTHALELLRDRGLDVAILDTDTDNVAAHQFYESLGFVRDYSACWYGAVPR